MNNIVKSNEFNSLDMKTDFKNNNLDYYFDSYSNFHIHEEMLSDNVRTLSYKNSIFKNKDLFKDKIVLDIGCGTGILSLFAAKAGAKHVYAIEKASIYEFAVQIVKDNNYQDKITIINEKVEECNLPVNKVDIIISEWMGYCLLYESMLDSVIFARDKWLRKDGLIFPNRAKLYMAGIEDYKYKTKRLKFWNKVYGFDMKAMKTLVKKDVLVDFVEDKCLVTNDCLILDLDIKNCTKEDVNFCNEYNLTMNYSDQLNGFVLWFDVNFTTKNRDIVLSTSPLNYSTHWKQTVLYIDDDIPLMKGEKINGSIYLSKNSKNSREIDIILSYHYKLENKEKIVKKQFFRLN